MRNGSWLPPDSPSGHLGKGSAQELGAVAQSASPSLCVTPDMRPHVLRKIKRGQTLMRLVEQKPLTGLLLCPHVAIPVDLNRLGAQTNPER